MQRNRWLGRLKTAQGGGSAVVPPDTTEQRDELAAQVESLLRQGLDFYKSHAFVEAAAAFERVLELKHDDANAHLALGRVRMQQDRWDDAADSLQLAVLFDPQYAEAHAELALVLASHGLRDAASQEVQLATARAGTTANVWAQCGRAFKILKDYARAEQCFKSATLAESDSADYFGLLGFVRFLDGQYETARSAYARALELDPLHVPTLHNSGLLDLETGYPQRGLDYFERANTLHSSPETQACIGHALRDLGCLDEACDAYEQVLAAHPAFGDARINLSYALLMRGDLEAGWAEYESRFEATGTAMRDFGLPRWRGEPLADRRLLVYAEQGIGDEIMFASCLPDALAHAAGCVIECNTRLSRLFARSFSRAQVHGGEKNDDRGWLAAQPACHYQVPIGSLPRYFRTSVESFDRPRGYLVADTERVEYWRRHLRTDARLHVGIAWRGGALRSRQWLRSIPLEQWLDLLRLPGVRVVALQHGDNLHELQSVRASDGLQFRDLSSVCADIDELAAVVEALDLIICVDSTLAHIAGALGKQAWVLLPATPEWRYPRMGERMPWYPSVRLFRQTAPRDARALMIELAENLRSLMASVVKEK